MAGSPSHTLMPYLQLEYRRFIDAALQDSKPMFCSLPISSLTKTKQKCGGIDALISAQGLLSLLFTMCHIDMKYVNRLTLAISVAKCVPNEDEIFSTRNRKSENDSTRGP
ncbi:hypothetical protein SUGI_0029540 [Cryptomeria japonica]|nr:hypothetical protein SUGI_0029540 [Cryptomeria japonica]